MLAESDARSKYDLFERLNTGGSALTYQEVRNCLMVMLNRAMYVWLRELTKNENFQNCTNLSDKSIDEQYDTELAFRFVTFRKLPIDDMRLTGDVNVYLTTKARELSQNAQFDYDGERRAFESTFELINQLAGDDAFRRTDQGGRRRGGFSLTIFEIVALGVGFHIEEIKEQADPLEFVRGKYEDWIKSPQYARSWAGVAASSRLPGTVEIGRQAFSVG